MTKPQKLIPGPPALGGEAMTDRLLRLHQVLEIIDVVPSTLYRWIAKGSFPAQIRVSPRCIAWRESDIRAWMESFQLGGKEADSDKRASPPPLKPAEESRFRRRPSRERQESQ